MDLIFGALAAPFGWLLDSGYFWIVFGPVLGFAAVVGLLLVNGIWINTMDHMRSLPGDAQAAFANVRRDRPKPFEPGQDIFGRGRVAFDGEDGPVDLTAFVREPEVPSRDTLVMGAADGQASEDRAGGTDERAREARPAKRRLI